MQHREMHKQDELGLDERNNRSRERTQILCLEVSRGGLIELDTALLTLYLICSFGRTADAAVKKTGTGLALTGREEWRANGASPYPQPVR